MGKRRRSYSPITTGITNITTVIAFSIIFIALSHIKSPPPTSSVKTTDPHDDQEDETGKVVPSIGITDPHDDQEEETGKVVLMIEETTNGHQEEEGETAAALELPKREGYKHSCPIFGRRPRKCNVSEEIIKERDWCTKQFFNPLPRTVSDFEAIVKSWNQNDYAEGCDVLYRKLNYWPFDYKSLPGDKVVLSDLIYREGCYRHPNDWYGSDLHDEDQSSSESDDYVDEMCLPTASYVQNHVDHFKQILKDLHEYQSGNATAFARLANCPCSA